MRRIISFEGICADKKAVSKFLCFLSFVKSGSDDEMIPSEKAVVIRRKKSDMGFDFSCTSILYETLEELDSLFCSVEDSLGDVLWFFRLMGGKVIFDHSDNVHGGEILECLEFVECDLGQLLLVPAIMCISDYLMYSFRKC